jgi:hypothetical protein
MITSTVSTHLERKEMRELITIGACWSGDNYYPKEYVNRLYWSCKRNTTFPFEFVVYAGPAAKMDGATDGIDPDIKVVITNLPYWWSGMLFFQKNPPGINTSTILYLDLDQVIIGSLDDIINFPSAFACMKDYPSHTCPYDKKTDANVSTTLIRNGAGKKVWEEYMRAGRPTWNVLGPIKGPLSMAAQEVVNEKKYGMQKDLFPENWICSYKLEVLKKGIPKDCRIVSFHGKPKPHECLHVPFVEENWR